MGNIEDNTWDKLTLEEQNELQNLCNQYVYLLLANCFNVC
jgi:hypothetical protein